jgi:hypothetical protein
MHIRAATALRALASRGRSWTFSERSFLLVHKSTGRRFRSDEYKYDEETAIKGFATRNREIPWVRLEDVELVE